MTQQPAKQGCLLLIPLLLLSCNAFKHGYTWRKAENSYNLVTGNADNFGDKRLKYIKGFRKHSTLGYFLSSNGNGRGLPGFIFEYTTEKKCRGTRLYYPTLDSVFIFEEPKKNNINSVFKEARKMDNYEHQTYERLKTGKQ